MKNNIFTKAIPIVIALILPLCLNAQNEAYKNPALSFDQRVDDLIKRLTLEEKVSLMQDASKPIERLGIKPYNWWNEALHGVARAGLATVFPQPIGMAATFDNDAVFRVFNAVSDEARAKHTRYSSENSYARYQGLTMWTPTINIFRDPRWGRGIETYGEDPYLTSIMGVAAVNGLQGPKDGKYDKIHACAKHFAVHSGPEWNRHSFNAKDIKPRDLYETYLPAFEALVKDANVREVMCAYNRFEDEPCCGSNRLLSRILREKWGFDGIVVADCGAIADFYRKGAHETHSDAATASAEGVLSGTDLDCGSSYEALIESVKKGYINESDLDVSVKRLLKARFELGEMDNNKDVVWSNIPYSVVASKQHNDIALDMARKSMTLLLNKNNILPLKNNISVAVMGPNANDSVMQWGNYNGTPPRTITILDGIRSALSNKGNLIYEQGCNLVENTIIRSVFDQCSNEKGKGFTARYWNNVDFSGTPVTTEQITTPFRFCTSGATVFAPEVNLTDFSAKYTGTFTPDKSGEVIFDFYAYGYVDLYINGVKVKDFANRHGSRKDTYSMEVKAGEKYNIEIAYRFFNSDAQLNFDLGIREDADIKKSIDKVKNADIVIFAGGISPSLEGEEMGVDFPGFRGGDRTDIELPSIQREFIKALKEAGKKVIFVNCSGSPIGLVPEIENCDAILQAWYPGQAGGQAVADVLFGKYNPAGRLPVTFYKNTAQLPDFEDYNMTGRTYRYMKEDPLFPFGFGLSYTTFKYGQAKVERTSQKSGEMVTLIIPVTNTGQMPGDEVVQVYLKKKGDADGPTKTLRAFKRVNIDKGQTENVKFELSGKQLVWWNEKTQSLDAPSGDFELLIGKSSKDSDLQSVDIQFER